jgi:hypothetical protein
VVKFLQRDALASEKEAQKERGIAKDAKDAAEEKNRYSTHMKFAPSKVFCDSIFICVKYNISYRLLRGSIEDNIRCGICLELPISACLTSSCSHLFCQSCLQL